MLCALVSIQAAYLLAQEQGSYDSKSGKCAKEETEPNDSGHIKLQMYNIFHHQQLATTAGKWSLPAVSSVNS